MFFRCFGNSFSLPHPFGLGIIMHSVLSVDSICIRLQEESTLEWGFYKSLPSKPDTKWFRRVNLRASSLSFKRGSVHKFWRCFTCSLWDSQCERKGNDSVQYIFLQAEFLHEGLQRIVWLTSHSWKSAGICRNLGPFIPFIGESVFLSTPAVLQTLN